MKPNDEPAYPCTPEQSPGGAFACSGKTLRDYFAAKAFERLVQAHLDQSVDDLSMTDIAREAYKYADAMLEERK